jgi:hypothetical protein
MKDYVAENERILNEWRNHLNQYEYFAPDGIMYKGEFRGTYKYYENSNYKFRWMHIPSGRENILWTNAPLRVLFLTKDQNTSGDTAWDVRSETYWAADENVTPKERGIDKSFFNSNLVYILYGILNSTADKQVGYKDAAKEALSFVDEQIFARINCKKEVGGGKCENYDLQKAIDRDLKLLKEQILNLDADIFVCCGYSESIEPTGSHILNFLNEIGYNFEQDSKEETGEWIYYDKKNNKVAINSYHLSYSGFDYNGLITAYSKFLKNHPDFMNSHRKSCTDNK